MKYLVAWKLRPVPPEVAEIALALNQATKWWIEAEKKAGSIIEIWSFNDMTNSVSIVEAESNDALYQKMAENPYLPFTEYTVAPLTDIKIALKVGNSLLKKMAGK